MTEIYVEGQPIDVEKGLSTLLSFSIDDIREPGARTTAFSKTIILPGTARNNRLFNHLFAPQGASDYNSGGKNIGANFNPAVSAQCVVFQDNIQVLKGVLRIMEVIIDGGAVEYEAAVFGELSGFVSSLAGKKLEDLNWPAYSGYYSLAYNETNIVNSWDDVGTVKKLIYPHIDYGGYSVLKHDWEIRTFRPAISARDYVDYIFGESGYRYESALFDTARFKGIVVPHNQKGLVKFSSELLSVGDTVGTTVIDPSSLTGDAYAQFGNAGFSGNFVGLIDNQVKYVGAPQTALFYVNLSGLYHGSALEVWLYKNGSPYQQLAGFSGGGRVNVDEGPVAISLATNDTIGLYCVIPFFNQPFDYFVIDNGIQVTIRSPFPVNVPVNLGDDLILRDVVPKGYLQRDLISSLLKLWNAYLIEDPLNDKLLKIIPYPDFYPTASQDAVDWTYKVDRSKPIRFKPMSELNARYYEFKMKGDSDYHNDQYSKRYNETYGTRVYDSEFEFSQDRHTVEVIFAGTPIVGYLGEDKVYSTILKQTGTGASLKEEQTDSVIRLLQCKKVTSASWDLLNNGAFLSSHSSYCYAGHFDDPVNPANDLNFGATKELFFGLAGGTLEVNQFNVYWSPYMAEITDKDSKLMTCAVYLNGRDIAALDFSKYVHVDGVLYRLMEIQDYNASSPDTCKAVLLKVINTVY